MLERPLPLVGFPVINHQGTNRENVMNLNVLERLLVLNLLPKEGTFTNLKLLRVARENLSFTEEENKALNFKQENDQIVWINDAVGDKEIDTGEVVTRLIVKELKKLDKEEKLKDEFLSLYDKYIKE